MVLNSPQKTSTKILNHVKFGLVLGEERNAWVTSRMAQRMSDQLGHPSRKIPPEAQVQKPEQPAMV